MTNKCTLLIDGNWLLQSRVSIMMDRFNEDNPNIAKEQASQDLKELMARSINVILNRFKCIDNIIMVSDGGSWRKQIPIPKSLEDTVYKGNRSQDHKIDWNYIYKALNQLTDHTKNIGITTSNSINIEGDDWIWYWSRRLNSEGVHCVIWSSDNDLKQLTQVEDNGSFTVWYNDRNGLWLPEALNNEINTDDDMMNFFMKPERYSSVLEALKNGSKEVHYINPEAIALSKIICGDSGDNIKSVFRYVKNGRTYRVTEKEWDKLAKLYNINTVDDLHSKMNQMANAICILEKYKDANPIKEDIIEMIQYNTKLVYLNESVIPETISMVMNQQEYKQYDVPYIRSNFRVLLDNNEDYIKNLFEGI